MSNIEPADQNLKLVLTRNQLLTHHITDNPDQNSKSESPDNPEAPITFNPYDDQYDENGDIPPYSRPPEDHIVLVDHIYELLNLKEPGDVRTHYHEAVHKVTCCHSVCQALHSLRSALPGPQGLRDFMKLLVQKLHTGRPQDQAEHLTQPLKHDQEQVTSL